MSSLNATPAAERVHIGIFGRRNAGKSSVINAITGQSLAIVSEIKGTTTDPVFKNMELLPLGPVTLIDTPGLDDEGELGKLRMQKGWQVLNKTDIAVLVIDGVLGMSEADQLILDRFKA
ncbi:MAG: 50S ribosome-binding GTPase, partial [Eubacteriaceae bacterium]|nr:50S ribosome-binding GTPase [Eubacteriaceae bacterium]